ncbi:hypothetical protein TrLO_g5094 [Triparma laevis f. longispina]|uniref:Flavodoxin-like domain-containing protein n=1 Tax=Triparma laevis f. longispina TaxID=1714387 RepID=A0A9W7EFG0_9STRA|nr:hypothetical protein TrLO_g5094 [Triparma laevis f. longispina]
MNTFGRRLLTTQSKQVDIVYGSFMKAPHAHGMEAEALKALLPENSKTAEQCTPPRSGNCYMGTHENLIKSIRSNETDKLIVISSSRNGLPPLNMLNFVKSLIICEQECEQEGGTTPLAGLEHAVFGNGNTKWFKTYMSIPRLIDSKLTKLGSKRIIPRGEYFESYKNLNVEHLKLNDWGEYLWSEIDKGGGWQYGDTWMEGRTCEVLGEENTKYLELELGVLEQYEESIAQAAHISWRQNKEG